MKYTLCLAVVVSLVLALFITPAVAHEFRGLYVDTLHPGIKNHAEVTQMVNAAKAANLNALIVQVRKRGTTYYDSSIEPKAPDIAADYDALADVIQQAHAVGLQVHAWLCVYQVATKSSTPGSGHVCQTHPEWLTCGRDGRTALSDGATYLDPGVPAVQDHIVALVNEIVSRYDVDGIHLDNIAYRSRTAGYNPTSVSRFLTQSGGTETPKWSDEAWCQWRREQVTSLVQKVKNAVGAAKPSAAVSASVFPGDPAMARRCTLQDWDSWTSQALVDFVIPMLYGADSGMPGAATTAMASAHGQHVYIGIGAYRIGASLAATQIQACRETGAQGVVLFSYDSLGPNAQGSGIVRLEDLSATVFAQPDSIPELP